MPHQCTSCARQFADGSKEMLSGCPDCGGTKFQFMPNGGAPAAEEPPSPPKRGTGAVTETVGHVATKLRDFVGDDPGPPKRRTSGNGENEPTSRAATAATTIGAGSRSAATDAPDAADGIDVSDGADAGGGTTGEGETIAGDETNGGDEPDADDASSSAEDGAQSTARSEMVSPDELPDGPAYVGARTEEDIGTGTDEHRGASTDGHVQPSVDRDADPEGTVVDTPSRDSPDLAELREELNDQFEGIRICEPGQYELNLMELYEREETIIALQENGRYVIEPPESWRGDDKG